MEHDAFQDKLGSITPEMRGHYWHPVGAFWILEPRSSAAKELMQGSICFCLFMQALPCRRQAAGVLSQGGQQLEHGHPQREAPGGQSAR